MSRTHARHDVVDIDIDIDIDIDAGIRVDPRLLARESGALTPDAAASQIEEPRLALSRIVACSALHPRCT